MKSSYEREIMEREMKLIKELSGMKFSFRKLKKAFELDALRHYGKYPRAADCGKQRRAGFPPPIHI